MRGIILAGGSGTRLHPITMGISKQLLPVYDKPMIYYPLSTLMMAGIRDILVITTAARRRRRFSGCSATARSSASTSAMRCRTEPDGLAQAFVIGAEHIGNDSCGIGVGRQHLLRPGTGHQPQADSKTSAAERFSRTGWPTRRPTVSSNSAPTAWRCRWRRSRPRRSRNYAVPGLYFYDNDVIEIAKSLEAVGPRRVRDHRRQPDLPRTGAGCRSRCWPAAPRGWTPARSTRCWMPATTSAPSNDGRA